MAHVYSSSSLRSGISHHTTSGSSDWHELTSFDSTASRYSSTALESPFGDTTSFLPPTHHEASRARLRTVSSFTYRRNTFSNRIRQNGYLQKVIRFAKDHDPRTTPGRTRIRSTILRSGTAYGAPLLDEHALEAKPQKYDGWRMGVVFSGIGICLCLAVELVMLVYALLADKPTDGFGILYQGNCGRVKKLNILLLIPLNVIATILIGASNYVMQCLSAPSRREVDKAHARGEFLEIGLSSWHNMKYGNIRKTILWWTLALSSVPIHLLLNSAIFTSLQANNYGIVVASNNLEDDSSWQLCDTPELQTAAAQFACYMQRKVLNRNRPGNNITRLDPRQCISKYANALQSTASDVMLITNFTAGNYSNLPYPEFAEFLNLNLTFDSQSGDVELIINQPLPGAHLPAAGTSGTHSNEKLSPNSENQLDTSITATDGIFLQPGDPAWKIHSLRAAFNAFDYRFWASLKAADYNFSHPGMEFAFQWNPSTWMCSVDDILSGKDCNKGSVLDKMKTESWKVTPNQFPIEFCYISPTTEECKVQYSLVIFIVIIVCDIVKLIAIFFTLYNKEQPLATLGDAISSFMGQPDVTTAGRCLVDEAQQRAVYRDVGRVIPIRARLHAAPELGKGWQEIFGPYVVRWRSVRYQAVETAVSMKYDDKWTQALGPKPVEWHRRQRRWLYAPSRDRWMTIISIYGALLGCTTAVFYYGMQNLTALGVTSIWDHGFSGPDPNAIFTNQRFQGDSSGVILQDIITINTPQLLFSMFYFWYNAVFTSMHSAHEWSQFAIFQKALRVSRPRGHQRSTYWLQLPFAYSLPLIATSSVLHWLVGRSLFLVKINVYGHMGTRETDRDISACGYSPLAILLTMLVLVVMAIVLLVVGWRKLDSGIPVVGTSSLAISAACHPVNEDVDVAYQALMWGVVKEPNGSDPGHCSMTAHEVLAPTEGEFYY